MDCRDAQFYLRLRRHTADELGADVTEPLDDHLTGCGACAADARAALSFDRAMASAMHAVPVPAGLHERIVRHVASKQGAILRRRVYRSGALAAAAILVACIGLGVFSGLRPSVNTEALVEDSDEQLNDPEGYARKRFAELKLPDRLPKDFDYRLYSSCRVVKLHGWDVPVVRFRSPDPNSNGFAEVYIIREDGRFDLKGLSNAQASHTTAEVVTGQGPFRGFTYVYVYTGGPGGLDQFLRGHNGRIDQPA